MEDISTVLADRYASNFGHQDQPVNEMINARLERIQELQRVREEHSSEFTPSTGDSESRHSRRERVLRQSSQRTVGRQGLSSIQRTPIRSQSFDNASVVSRIDHDSINFRDIFENARQNIFGPRASGSSESLNGGRVTDTPVMTARPLFQTGSDSGSGSSTPKTSSTNIDITEGLSEAFSNIRSSLRRSDSSGALGEMRSSSVTRDTSSTPNTQRFVLSNGSAVTRSSSRESRRESRFRRRTIQGVETNISRAIEQERHSRIPSVTRPMSPLVMESNSVVSSTSSKESTTTVTQSRENTKTSSYSSYSSTYSGYTSRKIDLFPEDGIPLLGFEDEKEVYVDKSGKCHWLDKTHPLIRELKRTKKVPEINIKSKLEIKNKEESDGYIATMEGDDQSRYNKLKELVMIARRRDSNFENGDNPDSIKSMSLFELYERGDFTDAVDGNDIDKKFKHYSLYTEPRPTPDLEAFLSSLVVTPLYDGVPRSHLPPEILEQQKALDEPEQFLASRSSIQRVDLSAFARESQSDGGVTRTAESRSRASHEQVSGNLGNGDSASMSRSQALHEASEVQYDDFGNESVRYDRAQARSEQAELRYGDSAGSAIFRRSEARRQQYLETRGSSEDGGTILQRRAQERRQQFLGEQHRNNNGSSVSQTRSENLQHQISAETHTNPDGSSVQRHSVHRHEEHTSSQTTSSENGRSSYGNTSRSRTVRQSSQSSIVRQSSQAYSDNADIHGEVDLVMQRLQMMQEDESTAIDTSHLDYEEMLMIQKALAENPSPPYSPETVEFEMVDTNVENETATANIEEEVIPVADEGKSRNQTEVENTAVKNVEHSSENVPDVTETDAQDVTAIVRSDSSTRIESAVSTSVEKPTPAYISAKESVITHTCVTDDTSETEEDIQEHFEDKELEAVTMDLCESSVTTDVCESTQEVNRKIVSSDSGDSSVSKDNVIEARTPRYQRLPSEGGESRLPLPSMDWSPLDKCNSPLSPNRFSFEDRKSGNTSSASSTTSENMVSSKFTVPKTSQNTLQTDSKTSVMSELTIEIPSTSLDITNGTSPNRTSANETEGNKSETGSRSSTSPLVKSRGASLSSSATPSPAGSETVTTVFEEFVQTIPLSVLRQYTENEDD